MDATFEQWRRDRDRAERLAAWVVGAIIAAATPALALLLLT